MYWNWQDCEDETSYPALWGPAVIGKYSTAGVLCPSFSSVIILETQTVYMQIYMLIIFNEKQQPYFYSKAAGLWSFLPQLCIYTSLLLSMWFWSWKCTDLFSPCRNYVLSAKKKVKNRQYSDILNILRRYHGRTKQTFEIIVPHSKKEENWGI